MSKINTAGFAGLKSSSLGVRVTKRILGLDFLRDGVRITGSQLKKTTATCRISKTQRNYVFERLDLGVSETVYGHGEGFTATGAQRPDGRNHLERGQRHRTRQSTKNIPFYLTNRGCGVAWSTILQRLLRWARRKSKVSSALKANTLSTSSSTARRQRCNRYTQFTGRPALPPAMVVWSVAATSFTTNYDEATVNGFIVCMAERHLPLHVFHFDCFWMKAFQWCDFEWDPQTFPDRKRDDQAPEGERLKGLRNGSTVHRSALAGVQRAEREVICWKRPDGSLWQWDKWQPGLAI